VSVSGAERERTDKVVFSQRLVACDDAKVSECVKYI
jgi:hypothetical protein